MCRKVHGLELIGVIFVVILCLNGCDSDSDSDFVSQQFLHKRIEENLKILETSPENCNALDQIAVSYEQMRQFQKAIVYFEKVIKVCPDKFTSRFQLGISYLMMNEADKAVATMEKAISDARKLGKSEWANAAELEKDMWLLEGKSLGKSGRTKVSD